MIENHRRGPSVLLDEQLDLVEARAAEILYDHVKTDDQQEEDEDDFYAQALDHIVAMQKQSQFSLLENYSSSGLYDAYRDLLKDIAREQEYYHKLIYNDKGHRHDSVLNLLRWFKLHAGARLEDPPSIQYEFIIENFDEFRIELAHHEGASPNEADPVLQSMLVLVWRVVEDVLDIWESLLAQGGLASLGSDVNLTPDEGDVGFVSHLWDDGGKVTTYQLEESGPSAEFSLNNSNINFFPSSGDLVRIEFADDPNASQYKYGNDNVPISRMSRL